ncbi:ruBisCO-associated protein-like [Vigna unguiculata]|uniref:Glycoside hydrolase superfamily n=1 Tax=Vigna unguiculata TaxID=3917 RepID=A0A4D6N9V6_VIGUN|nr:ruBisCO-associated protein-like [Vigna unguiculata]QCE09279.1 Glycoside hydrolase superfamily [Vigna unguiculata]
MLYIFRQYTFDNSFEHVDFSNKFLKEYQIALTFATDSDEFGQPTNGIFRPGWDLAKVTPEAIKRFREKAGSMGVEVKVFICIGNRGNRGNPFINRDNPFKILDRDAWIVNATDSLTRLIQEVNLQVDGIDVQYETIDASADDFIHCVRGLIKNLQDNGVITVASISPTFSLNKEFYPPLYTSVPFLFDYVDCQFPKQLHPIEDPTALLQRYDELTQIYPIRKLLAGFSPENAEPFVFFLRVMDILHKKNAPGASIYYNHFYAPL